VQQWVAGHYSRAWKDVNSFIPERWLARSHPQDSADTNQYAEFKNDQHGLAQPYSAGPRNCVGQQLAGPMLKLVVANMIWHFDFELAEESDNDRWMNVPIFGLVAEKKPLYVKLRYIG
jgi:cytochrome P450